MEYFHRLPPPVRDDLVASQAQLYKGIDAVADRRHLPAAVPQAPPGRPAHHAAHQHRADRARRDGDGARPRPAPRRAGATRSSSPTEGLVLATGYRHEVPAFLAPDRRPDRVGRAGPLRRRGATSAIDRDGGDDLRPERRAAHPRLRGARPRHGRVPQLVHHPRAARPRARTRSSARSPSRSSARRRHGRLSRCVSVPPRRSRGRRRAAARLGHPPEVARFWQMQDADVERVEREYRAIDDVARATRPSSACTTASRRSWSSATTRRTTRSATPTTCETGDVGMHFLVAPDRRAGPRLHARGDRDRDGAAVRRPGDAPRRGRAGRRATTAVHALNAAVGFEPAGDGASCRTSARC